MMGLDMYAYKVKSNKALPEVFLGNRENKNLCETVSKDANQIAYWRKHPNLHQWMHNLFIQKNGDALGSASFNCDYVELTTEDLDSLKSAIVENQLPHGEGFYFGTSHAELQQEDLDFIKEAKKACDSGYQVFYWSWW